MLTETEDTLTMTDAGVSGIEVENESGYPPEVIERWVRIAEEAEAQIARGELVPMTAAEFRAEVMRRRKKSMLNKRRFL